jgi:hypothetical protein
MVRNMKDLENYAIRAIDGTIGHVRDFYFDDLTWVVRYLVVETGSWLSSRKVLISPMAIGHPDWTEREFPVSITREQVKSSPDIDTDKPVSRQHEEQYLEYYRYPFYWGGAGLWGAGVYPGAMLGVGYGGVSAEYARRQTDSARSVAEADRCEDGDPHLRSCEALMKYRIEATDGGVGHVQGLLVDEETWSIRYLIVQTSNWWLGHEVLIAPQWIRDMSWPDSTVSVRLTRHAVKDAPPFDSAEPLNRDQEMGLYRHHGRTGYWADAVNLDNPPYRASETASQGAAQAQIASVRPRA